MGVRNCGELGVNLQKIVSRLMANDNLVNLLYFEDKDPMNHLPLTAEEQKRLQGKLNAEGKGEIAPSEEYHEFDLSHNELFTLDFINKQFE